MPYPYSFGLSFEFFPPSTTEQSLRLWRAVERLAPLGPDFMSVTYGAGGTTRNRSFAAIETILSRVRIPVAGHLTCVDATREEAIDVARRYQAMGAKAVVALRGDTPKGVTSFPISEDGFNSGLELVAGLAEATSLDIIVPAYPETHPEALNASADIDTLLKKQDAGAKKAITQFFFDNEDFLRFRDHASAAGVTMPIIPGILPIENFQKMCRFAKMCGASVPAWMHRSFENAESSESGQLLSTAICAEQCDQLLGEGVEHLHFYTLNNPDLVFDICRALGSEPSRLGFAAGNGAA